MTRTIERPPAGRVAVVTGATAGLGAATAVRLVDDGAAVALVGRDVEMLDELSVLLDDDGVVPIAADVSEPADMAHVLEVVRAKLGRIDLVVAAPEGRLAVSRAFAGDLAASAADGLPADLVHVGAIAVHATGALRAELAPLGVRVKAIEAVGASADDVADALAYAVAAPPAVNVAAMTIVPTASAL
ncbi:MAG TPA: SDR family NAD(P)-dependent oxidoreductase [Baekduia sp.]|uniref:SDR family NAD(P)-dependent oxidoreductase n=1 Tax=Baekduia sp. TaxID=2600305 RepID=UPI002D76F0DA|nr:SDR family NAD(P)-dependent oxidoreductase [Baekduia sp.]HET6505224.1 SDR family NAD(P)-dependent oxidoreductase [Baekduia sp.]